MEFRHKVGGWAGTKPHEPTTQVVRSEQTKLRQPIQQLLRLGWWPKIWKWQSLSSKQLG